MTVLLSPAQDSPSLPRSTAPRAGATLYALLTAPTPEIRTRSSELSQRSPVTPLMFYFFQASEIIPWESE